MAGRLRVEHIKCGVFANASEEKAYACVERRLKAEPGDGQAYVVTNLVNGTGSGRQPDEIDMVVIGPGGAIVIEVKHWDRSRLKGHAWEAEDQADLVTLKAKRVASQLRRVKSDLPFVPAAMLLTKDTKSFLENGQLREVRGVRLHGIADIDSLLTTVMIKGGSSVDAERLARALAPRHVAAAIGEVRRIGRVGELKLLSPPADRFYRVFSGRDISNGDRVILYLYDLSAWTAPNAELVARREFEAVQRLQKSPVLPSLVESFQAVPGYAGELFFFTLSESAAESIADTAADAEWTTPARLSFAISAMRALADLQTISESDGQAVLHRDLTPESVRVRADGQPLFSGWRWARLPRALSIAEHAPGIDSEYSAPEVRKNGLAFADMSSDVYSLSKVLLGLFISDDLLAVEARNALQAGLTDEAATRASAREIAEMLDLLAQPSAPPAPPEAPQRWDEGHIVDWERGRYRIVSQLGEGGSGRTFKLEQLDGKGEEPIGTFVGKVVVNPEIGPTSLNAYRKIRSIADHPGLSGIYQTAEEWKPDALLALLKWCKGEPLDSWRGDDLRVYAELTREDGSSDPEALLSEWAEQLCGALSVLHTQGWVHGDVSPANILIYEDSATLIDFDLACPAGSIAFGPGTVPYASSSRREQKPAKPSDDVFALGASLFHALTDRLPFIFGGMRRDGAGLAWAQGERERYPKLAGFLDRAVDPDPDRRFESASAALDFLRHEGATRTGRVTPPPVFLSPEPLRPNSVPRLKEILRAYPSSRFGNAETRGLDSDFAHDTYVETELDRLLPNAIEAGDVSLVILCGNAGDGKTAFLQHLAAELGVKHLASEQRVWDGSLKGKKIKINLDGAAAWKGRSADELLDELFEPFQRGAPKLGLVHLVAVNDGRLMEWIESYEERHGETHLTAQLTEALSREGEGLDPHVRLIELNLRSLVGSLDVTAGAISTEFVDRMVKKLIGGAQAQKIWVPCGTCSARMRCSMRVSAEMMGASNDQSVLAQGALLLRRLTAGLQAVHQRNEVHITARELKAALSYILFGTRYCEDLHTDLTLTQHSPADFAFDPKSELRQGDLLRELARLDPALEAHARIDRYLAGSGAPDPAHGAPRYPDLSLRSARRRAYFTWSDDQIEQVGGDKSALGLSGGRNFALFRDFPQLPDNEKLRIRDALCQGLSRLEALPEIALSEPGTMPLRIVPRTPTESAFWVGKPLSRFELASERFAATPGLGTLHRYLTLSYQTHDQRLEQLTVSLELFGLLIDLSEGVQILDAFSDDIFANLGVFTQRLAQEDERSLRGWNQADESRIYDVEIEQRDAGQTMLLRSGKKW